MMRLTNSAVLPAVLLLAAPGCVWYGPHTLTRTWFDRNTLNRPAFFVERLAHAPPPRERVERFRWQYGAGPGTPFIAPETVIVAPPTPPNSGSPASIHVPPPAPPPEPAAESAAGAAACTVEMPPRRPSVAWLFSRERG